MWVGVGVVHAVKSAQMLQVRIGVRGHLVLSAQQPGQSAGVEVMVGKQGGVELQAACCATVSAAAAPALLHMLWVWGHSQAVLLQPP